MSNKATVAQGPSKCGKEMKNVGVFFRHFLPGERFFPTSQSSVVEVASPYRSVVWPPVGSAGTVPTVMQAYSK